MHRWVVLGITLGAGAAFGHAHLTAPVPRDLQAHKAGPCGGVLRTGNPTVLTAGTALDVRWTETIDHPGYYRILFSAENESNFVVLADQLENPAGKQTGSERILLPAQPC